MASESRPFKIHRYTHTGFVVRSLSQSLKFWHEALGLPIVRQFTTGGEDTQEIVGVRVPGLTLHVAFIGLPGTPADRPVTLELLEFAMPDDASEEDKAKLIKARCQDIGSAHICLEVSGLDAILERMGPFLWSVVGSVRKISEAPLEGWRICYVRGPDGETIELMEIPESA